ncbi:hypothetical protein IJZ97_03870 [bacterium]|nr:hypothetical protein [bacterium]
MAVYFNPSVSNISFRQQQPVNVQAVGGVATLPQANVTSEAPKKTLRDRVSNVAKFFANVGEMTKATVKAVGFGAITAVTCLAGFWSLGAVPRSFKAKDFKAIEQPLKSISTKGKVITGLATAGVAAFHLIKGKLLANQRTANVDHQLKTGHRS